MQNRAINALQPENLAKAPRCGAKTRSGSACRSPAVRGRQRCRMHGGTNSGAPKGNRNAWIHGDRSAKTKKDLRRVREANRDLRILGKAMRGKALRPKEQERLQTLHAEARSRRAKMGG